MTDLIDSDGLNIEIIGLDKIYNNYKKDVDILIELLKNLKHVYNDEFANSTKIVIHHGSTKVELI